MNIVVNCIEKYCIDIRTIVNSAAAIQSQMPHSRHCTHDSAGTLAVVALATTAVLQKYRS
jgi:hypothetical protein